MHRDPELLIIEGILGDLKKGFQAFSSKYKTAGRGWMLEAPKDVIDLALKKYKNDYMKAYAWLKSVIKTDVDKEDDEKEYANLTSALKSFRKAIIKASGKDPEGGATAEDQAVSDKELSVTADDFEGQTYKEIAMDYMDTYKTPNKAAKVLSSTFERLKADKSVGRAVGGEIRKAIDELVKAAQKRADKSLGGDSESSYRDREVERRKAFYNNTEDNIYDAAMLSGEDDPKKALSWLSKLIGDDVKSGVVSAENQTKIRNVVNKLKGAAPAAPAQGETPAGTPAATPNMDIGALITKDKTYNDNQANLKDVLVRKINALPEDKKAQILKAMSENPGSAKRIAQAALKGG